MHKAGSTWLYNIFRSAFGSRPGRKRVGGKKTENYHFEPGKIYPAMFLSFQDFSALKGSDSGPCFFVVRDIRDTLVSLYFSMRYSHTDKGFPHIAKFRQEVEGNERSGWASPTPSGRVPRLHAGPGELARFGKPVIQV